MFGASLHFGSLCFVFVFSVPWGRLGSWTQREMSSPFGNTPSAWTPRAGLPLSEALYIDCYTQYHIGSCELRDPVAHSSTPLTDTPENAERPWSRKDDVGGCEFARSKMLRPSHINSPSSPRTAYPERRQIWNLSPRTHPNFCRVRQMTDGESPERRTRREGQGKRLSSNPCNHPLMRVGRVSLLLFLSRSRPFASSFRRVDPTRFETVLRLASFCPAP